MEKPIIANRKPYVMDMPNGTSYWCSCGRSTKQPFCDGSHKGTSFEPKKVSFEEPTKVAWCGCKQSAKGAFCDGTHAKL